MRRCHSRNVTRSSRRARCEPRQRCTPPPNAMCGFARDRSARPSGRRTPTGPCWPRRSSAITAVPSATLRARRAGRPGTSRCAARRSGTGDSQRSSSSTAAGMIVGIVDDHPAVLRMRGEERVRTGERVAHRVEAGDEEQEADVEDLVASELLAVDLGLHEAGDDVVGRLLARVRRPGSRSTRRSPDPAACITVGATSGSTVRVLVPLLAGAGSRRACAGTCASRLRVAPSGRGTPTTGTARRTPR